MHMYLVRTDLRISDGMSILNGDLDGVRGRGTRQRGTFPQLYLHDCIIHKVHAESRVYGTCLGSWLGRSGACMTRMLTQVCLVGCDGVAGGRSSVGGSVTVM